MGIEHIHGILHGGQQAVFLPLGGFETTLTAATDLYGKLLRNGPCGHRHIDRRTIAFGGESLHTAVGMHNIGLNLSH